MDETLGARNGECMVLQIVRNAEAVDHAHDVVTVHLGSRQVFVGLSIDFRDDPGGHDVERLERAITDALPEVVSVFIKPQKQQKWALSGANASPPAPP